MVFLSYRRDDHRSDDRASLTAGAAWALDEKKDEKEITAKNVMKKVNGKAGHAAVANHELKAEKPDGDKIATAAKAVTPLAEALAKAKLMQHKGDDAKWAELTKAYVDAAKDFEKAVGIKDKAAATKAFAGLTQFASCHKVFAQYSPNKLGED